MFDKESIYSDWVQRVSAFLSSVGPTINRSCSVMQSRAVLDHDVDVVFLGCNADEDYGYCPVDKERFYSGNPFFYNTDKYHNNDAMLHEPWKIWYKPYECFRILGNTHLMEDGNYVFMNAIFFGTKSLSQLEGIDDIASLTRQCLEFTEAVIHTVWKPKMIVCFSVPSCFDKLHKLFKFDEVGSEYPVSLKTGYQSKRSVKSGYWNGIKILGIPHPSQRISWDDMGVVCEWVLKEFK